MNRQEFLCRCFMSEGILTLFKLLVFFFTKKSCPIFARAFLIKGQDILDIQYIIIIHSLQSREIKEDDDEDSYMDTDVKIEV